LTGAGVWGMFHPQLNTRFFFAAQKSKRSFRQNLRFWTPLESLRSFGIGKPLGFLYRRLLIAYPEFMPTFYMRTTTGLSASGAGKNQVAYISGLDRYSNKMEVVSIVDKNIPKSVAKDGKEFFEKADVLERANGRSYRSLIIAIPREATDKLAWTQTFVDAVLKDKHAYRLAIHIDGGGNPHAHLMFCERGLKEGQTPKDFFSRKNGKVRGVSTRKWLHEAKAVYLDHVRKLVPDYTPAMKADPKISPELWRLLKESDQEGARLKALANEIKGEIEQAQEADETEGTDIIKHPSYAKVFGGESAGNTLRHKAKPKPF
jgi:MobA/MobL family